jgi:hypothetical protein
MAMGKHFADPPSEDRPEVKLAKTEMLLDAVRSQDEEISMLGATLRMHNTQNHYAQRLEESMRRNAR